MLLMSRYPDKYFDLAIVDPPYGLGDRLSSGGGKRKDDPSRLLYVDKKWDVLPTKEYWNELFDHPCPENVEYTPGGHFGISKEQIQIRSISFYQRILDYLENEFLSPWIIERLEPYIFNSTIKAKI
jgi:DNA modification methylase